MSEGSIVLLGGGHSHVVALLKLAKTIKNGQIFNKELILVSDQTHSPYSGMLPGVIAGHYQADEAFINLAHFCKKLGVRFITASVGEVDTENQQLILDNGSTIDYGLLSINIGARTNIDAIDGASISGVTVKPIDQLLAAIEQFTSSLSADDNKTLSVVGGGVASIEVILALVYRFKQFPNLKFRLISQSPTLLEEHNPSVRKTIQNILRKANIELISDTKIMSITDDQLITEQNTIENNNFIIWCNGVVGHEFFNNTNIDVNPLGFINVNAHLQSHSHPNIFASGDCSNFTPSPLAKSGVYAVRSGDIIADNIINKLCNKPLREFTPQKQFLCLISTGRQYAVASKGGFSISGRWVWKWKNLIDQRFVQQFR